MHVAHLLFASDASATSWIACRHAATLAKAFGARVTVLFVDDSESIHYLDSPAARRYVRRYFELVRERLRTSVAMLRAANVVTRQVELSGAAADAIPEWAVQNGVDLIMLTRHHERSDGRPLGSTTRAVLRRARVPVLVLQDTADQPADDVRYERILACSDLSRDSAEGLHEAKALAARLGAHLTVVHTYTVPTWMLLVDAAEQEKGWPSWHGEALRRRWTIAFDRWLDGANAGPVDRILVEGASPAHGIAGAITGAAAEGHPYDLVTIPTHGRGAVAARFLGSTTSDVLGRVTVPVLVYPRAWLHRGLLTSRRALPPVDRAEQDKHPLP